MSVVTGSANKQEKILKENLINNIPSNVNSFDILIYENNILKKHLIGCSKIDFVGRNTSGNKKADIKITHSTGNFLISLKNTPFKSWQSADTLAGNDIDNIVDEIIRAGKNKSNMLIHTDYNFGLKYEKPLFRMVDMRGDKKTLIVDLNQKSKEKVVFGSDILNKGAVIQINQNRSDLVSYSNNQLIINIEKYIDSKSQLDSLKIVYKVTNISSSRSSVRYPGIRVEAVADSEKGTNCIVGKYKNVNIVV